MNDMDESKSNQPLFTLEADGIIFRDVTIEGGNSGGTAIENKGDDTELQNVRIRGFDKAFRNASGSAFIYMSEFSSNKIGFEGLPGTTATLLKTRLENDIADIVYHEDVEIELFESIAKDVVEMTEGSLVPIDVEMNRQARKVLSSKTEEETRNAANNLFRSAWGLTERAVILRSGVSLVREVTIHTQKALEQFPF